MSKDLPAGKQVVSVPDEAIYFVVSNYLERRTKSSGLPVLVGVSTQTVQEVLGLFIDWAAAHGYVKNGILTIGNTEE